MGLENIYKCIGRITCQSIKYNLSLPFIPGEVGESVGTCFLIKESIVLTCFHIIESANSIRVSFPDNGKQTYNCIVLGIYPELDIAVLKIQEYKNDSYLELGDSDEVYPEQKVHAIGYTLGADKLKVTNGIISGRNNGDIQTDTPLNPGNSGGPLLNEKNFVIGINFQVVRSDGENNIIQNVGFVIPINVYKNVANILLQSPSKNTKTVILYKPSLGIYFNTTTPMLKKLYKCSKDITGVYIRNIVPTSSLYNSQLKIGDLICSITHLKNEYDIDDFGETDVSWNIEKISISSLIDRFKKGDNITIKYYNNKTKHIELLQHKIQSTNEVYNVIQLAPPYVPIKYVCFGGFIVMELSINHLMSEEFQSLQYVLKKELTYEKFLVITAILPGSYINRFDILENTDYIKSINNEKIHTLKQYREKCINLINKYSQKESKKRKVLFIIETMLNKKVVLSLGKIIKEDFILRDQFNYDSLLLNN